MMNGGVHDVEDCVDVAQHLAAEGAVDGDRLVIRGQSPAALSSSPCSPSTVRSMAEEQRDGDTYRERSASTQAPIG